MNSGHQTLWITVLYFWNHPTGTHSYGLGAHFMVQMCSSRFDWPWLNRLSPISQWHSPPLADPSQMSKIESNAKFRLNTNRIAPLDSQEFICGGTTVVALTWEEKGLLLLPEKKKIEHWESIWWPMGVLLWLFNAILVDSSKAVNKSIHSPHMPTFLLVILQACYFLNQSRPIWRCLNHLDWDTLCWGDSWST